MVSVTFLSLFGSFTLFTNVLANVFMTNPTASTTCQGGKSCSIAWMDDGKAPNLQQFGNASIGIWVGSVTSQTQLQPIQSSVNVATTAAVQFTVDPSIGPNGNDYFIRITSQSFQDPNAAGAFEEAFSAKFTLSGMTGTFNSTIQQEINGASSAPIPTPSPPASSSAAPSSASSSPSSAASSKTSNTASANGASKTGAAVSISAKGSLVSLVGAALTFAFAL